MGTRSRMILKVSGNAIPAAIPCKIRPTNKISKLTAVPPINVPKTKITTDDKKRLLSEKRLRK